MLHLEKFDRVLCDDDCDKFFVLRSVLLGVEDEFKGRSFGEKGCQQIWDDVLRNQLKKIAMRQVLHTRLSYEKNCLLLHSGNAETP